nr:unnamed protein product [Callosobruchus analis]
MTPHKIQIIEDWLLGADAKCLYTTKQKHTESRETTVKSTLSEIVKSELMINTTTNENIDNLQNIEAAANPHPLDSANHYRSENKQYPSTFVTQTTVATNEKNVSVSSKMIEYDKSDHFFEDFDDDNSIADPDFVPNFDDDDDDYDDDAANNHENVLQSIHDAVENIPHSKAVNSGLEVKDKLLQNNSSLASLGKSEANKAEELQEEPGNASSAKEIDNEVVHPLSNSFSTITNETVGVEKTDKKHYKDKKDCCIFCDKDVTHFGRHLFKWHKGEIEVQRIMSYDNNSKERRHELLALRKRGNFIKNRTNTKLRPVKRVSLHNEREPKDYLPCQYCLGFYRKRFLFRHTKRCLQNPNLGNKIERQAAQSCDQMTLLIRNTFKYDILLQKELFPRMRADEVGLIAKKIF